MTLAPRDIRSSSQPDLEDAARANAGLPPAFKPVALPALTAAVRAAYREPARKSAVDFPTLLRISAMLD
jgi:hypothetical protein